MGAIAKFIAPRIKSAGAGAKSALGGVISSMRKKRAEREDDKVKARTPKRKTAPPPSGALRSEGKRLVRDRAAEASDEAAAPETPPKNDRKRAVFGAVLGVLAVLAIYFVSSNISQNADESEAAVAAAEAELAAGDGVEAAPVANAPVAAAGEIPTAEVPLFGATPLSTTEPVPVPPDPGAASDASGADEPAADEDGEPAKAIHLDKEWGVGEVTDPTVFRLKMDGNIDGITGNETATGFTVTVPGRKSISSASGFKRKDKRLDSVNVVNYPDRAEVTLLFKKDVPAFLAKVKGKRLIIELATSKPKKKSSDKKKSSKKKKKK
jgi:hypothetical protein